MWLRYLAFLCLASACWADDCAPSPIALAIKNVTLSTGFTARGINASIGSPPQNFAFMPRWINNTFAFDTEGYCSTSYGTDGCITYRGGFYDMLESTTLAHADASAYPTDVSPYTNLSLYSDTLVLSNNVSIEGFPIGVPTKDMGGGYWPMNTIGIASNSTVIQALRSAGKIASRSWSIFWGLDGTTEQMDGIFVLGGYDKAKVQGNKYTQNVNPTSTCGTGMVLSITDMVLNFANGTDVSLFSNSFAALQVCLEPDFPALMTIPYDPYFLKFEDATNVSLSTRSSGILSYDMLYDEGDTVYTGDLTFTFQSGLTVRIPNDRFVVPDRHISSNGSIYIMEPPSTTFNSNQGVNANDMSILGRLFLSSVYLLYNDEAQQFTLWEANATTDTDIVAVDDTNTEVTNVCSATNSTIVASSSPSASSAGASSSASNSAKESLSSGAIAGIAVGGVAAVALVVGAVLFLLRRRRRQQSVRPAISNPYQDGMITKESMAAGGYMQEMPGIGLTQEMPAGDYRHEMPAAFVMAAQNQRYMASGPIQQERYELMG